MRSSLYALVVLTIFLIVSINVQPAWSLISFNYTSGYGAGTTVEAGAGPGYPVHILRDSGGEGVLSAWDSGSVTSGATTGTAESKANASLGTLGAYASASWWYPYETACYGWAGSFVYDTFTIVSSTLPRGTPASITLPWKLEGSISYPCPVHGGKCKGHPTLGENPAWAQLIFYLRALPSAYTPLSTFYVATLLSSEVCGLDLDLGGTLDLSTAFQTAMGRPLSVGDSFIVEAFFQSKAGPPGNPPARDSGSLTADFLATASFKPVSSTAGASIISAAQQALPPVGVPEFEAPTVLLVAVGLLSFLALRRKPIKPTKT